MSELTREKSLSTLRWLVEAGADEAIADEPVNRFAPKRPSPPDGSESTSPFPAARGRAAGLAQGASPKINASAEAVSLTTIPGAARALASSCRTLDELKQALLNFEGCELKRHAKNTVFADGTPLGRIMLIGEAPGRDEDEQGLPFVGRAGKLLDQMLGSIGLDRTKVYITNVLNWRPPQNRDPSPEEAAACLPFLHRHIELADPQILILLGAVSLRHVLGLTDGIMRARGKWELYQSVHLGRAIAAMPTLHPAFLLRQPAAKRLAWRDFLVISEKLKELGLA
jgi:DNA polymerase